MTDPNSELKVNIQNILFKRFRIQDGNPQYADALLASIDIAALIAHATREAWREGQKEAYEDIRDTYWTFKHENSTFDLERILAYRFDALGKDHD